MRFATLTFLALPIAAWIAPAWADAGYDVTLLAPRPGPSTGPTFAYGINAAGQVAGTSTTEVGGNTFTQAVSMSGTTVTPLANPFGGNSVANGINQAGEIVGNLLSYQPPIPIQAALWSGGTLTRLGVLSGSAAGAAYAINDAGQAVGDDGIGYNALTPQPNDALLWSDGQVVDLGTILGLRWSLTEATGINDLGEIVGFGVFEGQTSAFLLTPRSLPPAGVPEPNILALLAVPLLGWGWRRR